MADPLSLEQLQERVGAVPDFPIPGIVFRDITTLLTDPEAFRSTVGHLASRISEITAAIDGPVKLAAVESRGFLFGAVLGHDLGLPVVLVRKPGKLPRPTRSIAYELEYGTDQLEVQTDDLRAGDQFIIVDDLLATGGTVAATARLLRDSGAMVDHAVFVIDLPDLPGAGVLADAGVTSHSLISFDGH